MNTNDNEKLKAAYALNLWTVSISQILDYNDVNILKQEYDTIINNLNLENMPKDEALLDVIKQIMDEVTQLLMYEGDRKFIEIEYQHQLKNAVWSAVPNIVTILGITNPRASSVKYNASGSIIPSCIALATQVGIGYMNYRRNKAEYEIGHEKAKWQIQTNRMAHLNGLQKRLFDTAWRLAKAYDFPDEYRLTEKEISSYNEALMETNAVKRYHKLNAMKSSFDAYPVFWYQMGSTANGVFRSSLYDTDPELKYTYKQNAIKCFEKYDSLNKFNLLRSDLLTASWALEYLELLDLNRKNNPDKAIELIRIAEKNAGNARDVLELCAFAYLRIEDYDNAVRVFHKLVIDSYNLSINVQILSGLYIKQIYSTNISQTIAIETAQKRYRELPGIVEKGYEKYILKCPPQGTDLSKWKPEWNKEESFDEFCEQEIRKQQKQEEKEKKARKFYGKKIFLVYQSACENVARYFMEILEENRGKLQDSDYLPHASMIELKEYKKKSNEYEQNGAHIIMLGDSYETKKLYDMYLNLKGKRWDSEECYDLGIRYISYNTKTILLVRPLKDEKIDDLLSLANTIFENRPISIPQKVNSVKYAFLNDFFKKNPFFKKEGKEMADALTLVTEAPFIVLGQLKELVENGIQWGINLSAYKGLEFLQYCVAIYKYLESKNAIVD